jgi:hypothetical protein
VRIVTRDPPRIVGQQFVHFHPCLPSHRLVAIEPRNATMRRRNEKEHVCTGEQEVMFCGEQEVMFCEGRQTQGDRVCYTKFTSIAA